MQAASAPMFGMPNGMQAATAPMFGMPNGAMQAASAPMFGMPNGEEEKVPLYMEPTAQSVFRGDYWCLAFVGGLCFILPVIGLGCAGKIGGSGQDSELSDYYSEDGWNERALWEVALPGFILFLVVTALSGRLSTQVGFSMIEERSHDRSLQEAIRTNMTASGVILALFLSILGSMLLYSFDDTVNEVHFPRTQMWYYMILLIGIEQCVRGSLICAFYLMYSEGLNEKASQSFTADNLMYIGEPGICIVVALTSFAWATVLWIFVHEGKYAGIGAACILGYSVTRIGVMALYVSRWQNPHVPEELRENRKQIRESVIAVDGTKLLPVFGGSGSKARIPEDSEDDE